MTLAVLLSDHPDWGRPGQHTGYWHYYHLFGEGFIGGVAALEAALEPISDVSRPELGESLWVEPYKNMTIGTRTKSEEFTWKTKPHRGVEFDRMVIPWSVEWRDGHGLNELLFKHLYGNSELTKSSSMGSGVADGARYRRGGRVGYMEGGRRLDLVTARWALQF